MDNEAAPKRPSFLAYQVNDGQEQSFFNRVGAAFAHKDGQGHTVQLDSLPIDGRIVLRSPQERIAETKSDAKSERPHQRGARRDLER